MPKFYVRVYVGHFDENQWDVDAVTVWLGACFNSTLRVKFKSKVFDPSVDYKF